MYSSFGIGVISLIFIVTGSSSALEDGNFLKITSVSSGNVLTLSGTDSTDGKPAILSPWSGQSSQKFLAVEAVVAGDSYLLMPQRQRYPWQRFIRNGGTAPYKNRHDDLPDWTMVLEGNTNNGQVSQEARDSKLHQQWRAVPVDAKSGNKYLIKNRQNNQCLQAPGSPTSTSTGSASVTSTTAASPTTTAAPPTTTTAKPSFFRSIWSSIRSVFSSSDSNSDSSSSSIRSTRNAQPIGSASSATTSATGNAILAPCENSDTRQQWLLETLAYEF